MVIGDIHGQLDDMLLIFERFGYPSEQNKLLFNGDIVDRGDNSIECLLLILALKIVNPGTIFVNRGNHEARNINQVNGFLTEITDRYDTPMFDLFSEFMGTLPMASIIEKQIYVVHAGLFNKDHLGLTNIMVGPCMAPLGPPLLAPMDPLWPSDPLWTPYGPPMAPLLDLGFPSPLQRTAKQIAVRGDVMERPD